MSPIRTCCLLAAVAVVTIPATGQQIVENSAEELVPTPAVEADDMKSGTMQVSLKEGLKMTGTPVELEAIKINSLFGEASIPLHTIAGIRFAQQSNEQTTVVLLNGDALTGEISLTEVKFVCDWGEAKVHAGHIDSIVFRPDLAWSSVSTPNGPRWRLTKVQQGVNQAPAYRVYRPR